MNTRSKILASAALIDQPAILVIGTFDPLLAAHAERLAELAQPGAKLVVAVADSPNALLPLEARREMVAALRVVDFVVPLEPAASSWAAIHDDTALHLRLAAEFRQHVLERTATV